MIPSKSTSLRQEAEEQLIQKSSKTSSQLSEADVLKLNHELQVHQIELEMQKAELQLANEAAVTAIKEYTELYNLAPMGYFTLSKEGEITGLNLGGAKMLGKERYYLLGTRFGFFVTNQSKPIFNDFLDKVFTSKAEETSELKLSFEGYSEKYVQLSGILNNNGEQCFVTMLDITKSKHKEKEKREAELIIANKERTFQNEEKGKRAAELIVANKELAFQNEEKGKRAAELIVANKELAFQNEEKGKRAAELIVANKELAFQITEKGKRATELIIAYKELALQITEKEKRADELIITNIEINRLLQLNLDKNRFMAILGHDLRSPFNGLLGLSDLLTDNIQDFDIEQIKKMAGLINTTAHSTYHLLEDILLWARTQQGKIPFKPQTLKFRDICMNILEVLNPTANEKKITINYTATDQLTVFADADMIKTVLRNLISNAIKFTNIGGTVNISAEQTPSTTTISVSDNGVGMSPDNIAKLFDIV